MELNKYIRIFNNILTERQLDTLFQTCANKFDFSPTKIILNNGEQILDTNIRDVTEFPLYLDPNSITRTIWKKIFNVTFADASKNYFKDIGSSNSVSLVLQTAVLRYEKSGHYDFHVDHGTAVNRVLSMIYFVNDDYDGGSLVFGCPSLKHFLTIPKKKNTLIVWPSNFLYPHRVEPVTEGIRYSVVGWLA